MTDGFSLIEVVVVLLILGIAGTVATPALMNRQSTVLDAAVAELEEIIEDARTLALERGADVRLVIDRRSGGWWVVDDRSQVPPLHQGRLRRPFPAEESAANGRLTFRFTPAGWIAGNAIILPVDGHTWVLEANPWNGSLEVRDAARLRSD